MSTGNNFSFESDDLNFKIKSRVIIGEPEVPAIIKVLVKNKFVKNEKQAIVLLLTLFTLILLITIFLINRAVTVSPAIIDPEIL